jgi:hypothetical protein
MPDCNPKPMRRIDLFTYRGHEIRKQPSMDKDPLPFLTNGVWFKTKREAEAFVDGIIEGLARAKEGRTS